MKIACADKAESEGEDEDDGEYEEDKCEPEDSQERGGNDAQEDSLFGNEGADDDDSEGDSDEEEDEDTVQVGAPTAMLEQPVQPSSVISPLPAKA